jgi:hypothetical protein
MNLKSCFLLGLAFATILASAARADVVDNALANHSARRDASGRELAIPYLAQQYGIARTSVRPDDRAGIRGPSSPTTAPVSHTTGGALQWDATSIGAAAAVGAVLLALGVAITVRQRSQLLY